MLPTGCPASWNPPEQYGGSVRTPSGAVTSQRTLRKIRAFFGSPGGGREWTAAELALLGTNHDEVVAERIGRTVTAVQQKRLARKVPVFRDRRGVRCRES